MVKRDELLWVHPGIRDSHMSRLMAEGGRTGGFEKGGVGEIEMFSIADWTEV